MRAFQLKEYVGPAGLELVELPAPEPAPDAVLVDVRAIGVNFPDLLMTKGQYQFRPDLPTVPGCRAGQVVRAPEGSGRSTGDRVAAFAWQGSLAEQAAIPLDSLVRVPDEVDFAAAAAMVINYHTVLFALFRRGRVQPGETVLVMGAGGGIGTAAVQVALGLGARVVTGVADEDQVATARSAGAPAVVVLDRGFSARIRELTGGRRETRCSTRSATGSSTTRCGRSPPRAGSS